MTIPFNDSCSSPLSGILNKRCAFENSSSFNFDKVIISLPLNFCPFLFSILKYVFAFAKSLADSSDNEIISSALNCCSPLSST